MKLEKVYTIDYILKNEIDKKAYGFIYITINLLNGMKYIGQRKFYGKWQTYLGSGIHLKRAIRTYNECNFYKDIVAIAYSKEELNLLEVIFIKNNKAVENNNYYNISYGGNENPWACKTEKEKLEISKKISESLKGTHPSEKTRQKLCEVRKGKGNPNYGKQHSQETKLKISNSRKGKLSSIETKQKLSKITKGENNPRAKKIICTTTGETFTYIKEAAKFYKIKSSSNIIECCKNYSINKSAGKHPITKTKLRWMYYEDWEAQQIINA